jgi:hypothetical protein
MFRNVKIGKLTIYVIFGGLLIFFFANAIPAMIKEHEASKLRLEIEQLSGTILEISNKHLECELNMVTRKKDNLENRKKLEDLMDQYNNRFGFIKETITAQKSDEKKTITLT